MDRWDEWYTVLDISDAATARLVLHAQLGDIVSLASNGPTLPELGVSDVYDAVANEWYVPEAQQLEVDPPAEDPWEAPPWAGQELNDRIKQAADAWGAPHLPHHVDKDDTQQETIWAQYAHFESLLRAEAAWEAPHLPLHYDEGYNQFDPTWATDEYYKSFELEQDYLEAPYSSDHDDKDHDNQETAWASQVLRAGRRPLGSSSPISP